MRVGLKEGCYGALVAMDGHDRIDGAVAGTRMFLSRGQNLLVSGRNKGLSAGPSKAGEHHGRQILETP